MKRLFSLAVIGVGSAILFLMPLPVSAEEIVPAGNLRVLPEAFCQIPITETTCTVEINWQVSDTDQALVWVRGGNFGEAGQEFDRLDGRPQSEWIYKNADFIGLDPLTFELYTSETALPEKLVKTVEVRGVPAHGEATGELFALPSPCQIVDGAAACTTTITWAATNAIAPYVKQIGGGRGCGAAITCTFTGSLQEITDITEEGVMFELHDFQGENLDVVLHSLAVTGERVVEIVSGGSFKLTTTEICFNQALAVVLGWTPPAGQTDQAQFEVRRENLVLPGVIITPQVPLYFDRTVAAGQTYVYQLIITDQGSQTTSLPATITTSTKDCAAIVPLDLPTSSSDPLMSGSVGTLDATTIKFDARISQSPPPGFVDVVSPVEGEGN